MKELEWGDFGIPLDYVCIYVSKEKENLKIDFFPARLMPLFIRNTNNLVSAISLFLRTWRKGLIY